MFSKNFVKILFLGASLGSSPTMAKNTLVGGGDSRCAEYADIMSKIATTLKMIGQAKVVVQEISCLV